MNKNFLILFMIFLGYCSNSKGPDLTHALVTVNHRAITEQDFSDQAQSIASVPGTNLQTKDGRINILKDMISEELVFQEALKEQYHLKNISIKHDIVKAYLHQKFGVDVPEITEEQIDKFYKDHQTEIDTIRASHILVRFDKNKDGSEAEAKQKLEKIRQEILNKKITFADAAKKNSEDGSKDNGGDLKFFTKAQMVGPFSEAAFNLKKIGEVSPVIESEFGFHIIQLTGDQRGVEFNKEKIRWKLYQDDIQPKVNAFFAKLREGSSIKMLDKDLMAIPVNQF